MTLSFCWRRSVVAFGGCARVRIDKEKRPEMLVERLVSQIHPSSSATKQSCSTGAMTPMSQTGIFRALWAIYGNAGAITAAHRARFPRLHSQLIEQRRRLPAGRDSARWARCWQAPAPPARLPGWRRIAAAGFLAVAFLAGQNIQVIAAARVGSPQNPHYSLFRVCALSGLPPLIGKHAITFLIGRHLFRCPNCPVWRLPRHV